MSYEETKKRVDNYLVGKINKQVMAAIKKHAEEKGISYEEAAKRCYLTINGEKIKPFDPNTVSIDIVELSN